MGRVLRASHLRDKVIIASKAGLLWDEHHKTRNNLSKASLMEECEASLRRLQTDHIDIYQMHWPDPSVPLEETAEALAYAIGILDGVSRVIVCLVTVNVFFMGMYGYFWGAALCHLLPGLVSFGYFISGKWKTRKLLVEQ